MLLPIPTLEALAVFIILLLQNVLTESEGIPVIQPFAFPQYVSIDERVVAICGFKSGRKPFTFKWTKDQEDIFAVPNVSVDTQGDYSVLTVSSAKRENSGNYTCTVSNAFGKDSHSATFVMKASPEWTLTQKDVKIVEGGTLNVTCKADGMPKPEISWKVTKGGKDVSIISREKRILMTPDGNLYINQLTAEDGGVYYCEANNGIGTGLKKSFVVEVSGKNGER